MESDPFHSNWSMMAHSLKKKAQVIGNCSEGRSEGGKREEGEGGREGVRKKGKERVMEEGRHFTNSASPSLHSLSLSFPPLPLSLLLLHFPSLSSSHS